MHCRHTAFVFVPVALAAAAAAATTLTHSKANNGWANSSTGVHTFLTFASGGLVRGLEADPNDPRAARLDFVWGLSESQVPTFRATKPDTVISK